MEISLAPSPTSLRREHNRSKNKFVDTPTKSLTLGSDLNDTSNGNEKIFEFDREEHLIDIDRDKLGYWGHGYCMKKELEEIKLLLSNLDNYKDNPSSSLHAQQDASISKISSDIFDTLKHSHRRLEENLHNLIENNLKSTYCVNSKADYQPSPDAGALNFQKVIAHLKSDLTDLKHRFRVVTEEKEVTCRIVDDLQLKIATLKDVPSDFPIETTFFRLSNLHFFEDSRQRYPTMFRSSRLNSADTSEISNHMDDVNQFGTLLRMQTDINRQLHDEVTRLVLAEGEAMHQNCLSPFVEYNKAINEDSEPEYSVEKRPSINLRISSNSPPPPSRSSVGNALQLFIRGVFLSFHSLNAKSSFFFVIEFYNFEPLMTPLLMLPIRSVDFTCCFEVNIDDYFLNHLRTGMISLDLYSSVRGCPLLLGRSKLPLVDLLGGNGAVSMDNLPIFSLDDERMGEIQLDLSLSNSICDNYRLFLRRHESSDIPTFCRTSLCTSLLKSSKFINHDMTRRQLEMSPHFDSFDQNACLEADDERDDIIGKSSPESAIKRNNSEWLLMFLDAEQRLRAGDLDGKHLEVLLREKDVDLVGKIQFSDFSECVKLVDKFDLLTERHLSTFCKFFAEPSIECEMNYVSFLEFFGTEASLKTKAVVSLQSYAFSRAAIHKLLEEDPKKTGFLDRAIIRCKLHVDDEILSLFEYDQSDCICYEDMLEFLSETCTNRAIDIFSRSLRPPGALQSYFNERSQGEPFIAVGDLSRVFRSICTSRFEDIVYENASLAICRMICGHGIDELVTKISLQQLEGFLMEGRSNFVKSARVNEELMNMRIRSSMYQASNQFGALLPLQNLIANICKYDVNGSGHIPFVLFTQALAKFPILCLLSREINHLAEKFSSVLSLQSEDGVNYTSFFQWLRLKLESGRVSCPSAEGLDFEEILTFLTTLLGRGKNVSKYFESYDSNGSGFITVDQFVDILKDLGLTLPQCVVLNTAGTDTRVENASLINYHFLLSRLMTPENHASVEEMIAHQVGGMLSDKRITLDHLESYFAAVDTMRRGYVGVNDMNKVFLSLGLEGILETPLHLKISMGKWFRYPKFLEAMNGVSKSEKTPGPEDSPLLNGIRSKLKLCVREKIVDGIDYHFEFERFDTDHRGHISKANFLFVLSRLSFPVSEIENHNLIALYTARGEVDYVRFLYNHHPFVKSLTINQEAWQEVEKIRLHFRREFDSNRTRPHNIFHSITKKSVHEFSTVKSILNGLIHRMELGELVSMSLSDIIKCMEIQTGSNKWNFNYFLTFIYDPLFFDVLWKLRRMSNFSSDHMTALIHVLNRSASKYSGMIRKDNLGNILMSHGISLSARDIFRLARRLDFDQNAEIDYVQFVRCYLGSHHMTTTSTWLPSTSCFRPWSYLRRWVLAMLSTGSTFSEIYALCNPGSNGDIVSRALAKHLSHSEVGGVLALLEDMGHINKHSFFRKLDLSSRE
jgi:Ca2+-binding EF-hand superfamily protein